jgi:hypothetical protein
MRPTEKNGLRRANLKAMRSGQRRSRADREPDPALGRARRQRTISAQRGAVRISGQAMKIVVNWNQAVAGEHLAIPAAVMWSPLLR